MKKKLIVGLFISLFLGVGSACTDYLDKAPESGMTDQEVFTKYANFKQFFYSVYEGKKKVGTNWREYNLKCAYPLWLAFWDQKFGWDGLTEIADYGRRFRVQDWKAGQMGSFVNMVTYDGNRRPILESMFTVIRVSNIALANVDAIKDAADEDREDMRGQAYFARAYAHFNLMRIWGPMPHITYIIGADDEWDIPRLSRYDSYKSVALDMDSAFTAFEKAGRIRRDPGPGEPGHLTDPDQARPNGVAAKAIKARALLYAASPLNNANGTKDWEDAAAASWEAIRIAEQYKYALLDFANYTDNYYGAQYSNEQIWAWNSGNGRGFDHGDLQGLQNGVFASKPSGNSGECPTQNMIDKFETKWGEPLNTEEDRARATALGHYNEQDPYKNRDPRFYKDIIYNEAPIVWNETGNKAAIYYEMIDGQQKYATHIDQKYMGVTRTGYYTRKYFDDMSVKNKIKVHMTDPLVRLGELYLNYAEAVNEAYGPKGSAPGGITAVQALNKIRNRAGMPDVLAKYTGDKDLFRERIKNERAVELCFEGFHHYFDIRRWKDAPQIMSSSIIGMDIEKVPVSDTYPTGFKYIRLPLSPDRQCRWHEGMYYFPFDTDDYYKMRNFDTSLNPAW